jgi:DMSO/TMAO reductase YedYZ molybdopterin-dependent catalytic subunit
MKLAFSRKKSPFLLGFLGGLGAGIIASAIMIVLSVTGNGVSLPEEFGSEITALMPGSMFEYLHQVIGADAKQILFYIILAGQCLVFALSGGIFSAQLDRLGDRLRLFHGLLLALILWLFAGVILLPLTQAGFFGMNLEIGTVRVVLSLALTGIVFGLIYVSLTNWLVSLQPVQAAGSQSQREAGKDETELELERMSRRSLLKHGLVIGGIVVVGAALWQFITSGAGSPQIPVSQLLQHYKSKIIPPPIPNYGTIQPVPNLSPEITPNDQFYLVSKNLISDPVVNGATWQLTVDGLVEHPFTLNYAELMAMPRKAQYETLECISNTVGGQYMSNALWEGIPLATFLQRAGVKPGATKVVFHAADDYADSIHLSKALEPTTLLAVRMNGVTLPQEHGFPVRMLVPGIYGMKHCKWLTRIEVVNYDFQGYWEQRGWDDTAAVRMTSRIDTPLQGSTVKVNRPAYIAGVAFSGNKGISEVDVSLDSGQTWQRAVLKQPPSDLTWVIWEYTWKPTTTGGVYVTVRAIDLEGNVQDPTGAPTLPSGSSGYHTISFNVA